MEHTGTITAAASGLAGCREGEFSLLSSPLADLQRLADTYHSKLLPTSPTGTFTAVNAADVVPWKLSVLSENGTLTWTDAVTLKAALHQHSQPQQQQQEAMF
jgi:hypothetical protein